MATPCAEYCVRCRPAFAVDDNHATVAVETLFQIVECPLRGFLRGPSLFYVVRGPLAEHQLHHGLAPSGGGDRRTEIVGITAAANQR